MSQVGKSPPDTNEFPCWCRSSQAWGACNSPGNTACDSAAIFGAFMTPVQGSPRLVGGRPCVDKLIPSDRADEWTTLLESARAGETVENFPTVRVRRSETVFPVLAHRLTDPGDSRRGLDCRDLIEQPITEGWSVCNWARPFTKAESGQKSRVVVLRHQAWLIQQWNPREAGWNLR